MKPATQKKIPQIDAYIRSEPAHAQRPLKAIRSLVHKVVPASTEKIAWSMPTFYLEGNLLHIAAFKDHISLFPGTDAVAFFKSELARRGSPTSKGTIQIPYGTSLPPALLTRIVKFCARRNLAAAAAKAAKKNAKSSAKAENEKAAIRSSAKAKIKKAAARTRA